MQLTYEKIYKTVCFKLFQQKKIAEKMQTMHINKCIYKKLESKVLAPAEGGGALRAQR